MKIKHYLSVIAAACMLAVGCNNDPTPTPASMKIEPASLQFGASENLTGTVKVTSSRDWKVATAIPEWMNLAINGSKIDNSTVVPASASAVTVEVTVLANTGMERGETLTLNGGTLAKGTLQIRQAGSVAITTLADVRDMLPSGESATIPEGTIVKGIVISNRALDNLTSNKSMYIQDSSAGINVFCAANHTFDFGDEVSIDLGGQALKLYKGAYEIDALPLEKVSVLSKSNIVEPIVVNEDDFLANKYEGRYVSIKDVQVAESDLSKNWVMNNNTTSIGIVTKTGKTFVAYSGKYSKFGSEKVAQGSGTISGIGTVYNDGIELIFAQTSDYAGLTNERFKIDTPVLETEKIALAMQASVGTDLTLNNVTVVATAKNASTEAPEDYKTTYLVTDTEKKDYMLVFMTDTPGVKVGDNVNVHGTLSKYSNMWQISSSTTTINSSGTPVVHPEAEDITSTFDEFKSTVVKPVKFTGTLEKNKTYLNIAVNGASKMTGSMLVPDVIDYESFIGVPNVEFEGYYLYTTGSKYNYIILTSIKTSGSKYLNVSPATAKVAASATSTTFEIASNVDWTCTSKTAGFTVDKASGNGNATVTVSFEANTSTTDEKVGTIEVASADAATQTFVVTQAKADDPSLVVYELTNAEIIATYNALKNAGYQDVTYESESGTWTGQCNVSWNKDKSLQTTYIQIRNKSNAQLTTPEFSGFIRKIDITMAEGSQSPADRNIYAVPLDTDLSNTSKYPKAAIEKAYGSVLTQINTGQTYSMEITADVKKVMLISFDGAAYFNSIKVYVQPTK
ncbi:MAG: BACON domain-containing protein [Bacteroidales bacterium]|nr:BACON domain-containing protein [Bacteroidales bacterium]